MTPWVLRLIAANVAVFFLQYALPGVTNALMLAPAFVQYRPWTVVTYMFLHGGLMHIFFNMIALFFFGPQLELRLGSKSFLLLYFLSGLGGAAASILFAPQAAVVGASAAVFGVMLGFATFWPDARIYIWAILPVKAKWLVLILVALSLFSGITGAQAGVAHFAHLGGFVTGFLYLRWWMRREKLRRSPPAVTTMEKMSGKLQREEKAWRSIDASRLHEINRVELERILRKIDLYGVDSLTRDEREFMNRMT